MVGKDRICVPFLEIVFLGIFWRDFYRGAAHAKNGFSGGCNPQEKDGTFSCVVWGTFGGFEWGGLRVLSLRDH
jgi:hypothetical protein